MRRGLRRSMLSVRAVLEVEGDDEVLDELRA